MSLENKVNQILSNMVNIWPLWNIRRETKLILFIWKPFWEVLSKVSLIWLFRIFMVIILKLIIRSLVLLDIYAQQLSKKNTARIWISTRPKNWWPNASKSYIVNLNSLGKTLKWLLFLMKEFKEKKLLLILSMDIKDFWIKRIYGDKLIYICLNYYFFYKNEKFNIFYGYYYY